MRKKESVSMSVKWNSLQRQRKINARQRVKISSLQFRVDFLEKYVEALEVRWTPGLLRKLWEEMRNAEESSS